MILQQNIDSYLYRKKCHSSNGLLEILSDQAKLQLTESVVNMK